MDINEKKLSIISDIVESYDLGLLLGVQEILGRSDAASISNEKREIYSALSDEEIFERMDVLKISILKAFIQTKESSALEAVYSFLNYVDDFNLTEEEARELDEILAEDKAHPNDIMTVEEFKERLGRK